jgi:hypothetical protein
MSLFVKYDSIRRHALSVSHLVQPGVVLTQETSDKNLYHRSQTKSYRFRVNSQVIPPDINRITVFLDDNMPTINTLAFLMTRGVALPGFKLQDASGNNLSVSNINQYIFKRYYNDLTFHSYLFTFDSLSGVRRVVFEFPLTSTNPQTVYEIGTVYAGKRLESEIHPKSMKISFGAQGSKQRTRGGQISADKNNSYMNLDFKAVAKPLSFVSENYFDLNYQASVSEPIIFIPELKKDVLLYGTQKKPCEANCVEAKNSDQEWYYETKFSLEEEF